jgi:hypothetical protein
MPKKYPKHKHRWTKPHMMSTVGWVKACRAKYCPTPMKAVRSPKVMKDA